MSIVDVKVPQLSESVSEATLLTWHKQVGEAVNEGENLIDVETDKVVLELPAAKSGVLAKIIKGDGEKVTSNELIAQIDTAAAAAKPVAPQAAAPDIRQISGPACRHPGLRSVPWSLFFLPICDKIQPFFAEPQWH